MLVNGQVCFLAWNDSLLAVQIVAGVYGLGIASMFSAAMTAGQVVSSQQPAHSAPDHSATAHALAAPRPHPPPPAPAPPCGAPPLKRWPALFAVVRGHFGQGGRGLGLRKQLWSGTVPFS